MKLTESIYQNKIVNILKVSKQTHFKKYFKDSRKKCKALWDGIHQILYSKKKKDNIPPIFTASECTNYHRQIQHT